MDKFCFSNSFGSLIQKYSVDLVYVYMSFVLMLPVVRCLVSLGSSEGNVQKGTNISHKES